MGSNFKFAVAAALGAALALSSAPTSAQAQVCTCDNTNDTVCVSGPTGNGSQAFEVTLLNFFIDGDAGTTNWDYRICDKGPNDATCPSGKSLSHVDIVLGDLSACLTSANDITFTKIGDSAGNGADLSCVVEQGDPSCAGDEGTVAKCDVVDTNPLDPGDCVDMRLTIAGETAGIGVGATTTLSKAGPDCATACILGPSCTPCDGEPPPDQCLTRTPGFWGTHPHITALFVPVTTCGNLIDNIGAGNCSSATEAMCVSPGRESKKNRAYASLVRQVTAAKLNLAATAANGGFCGGNIAAKIDQCEANFCTQSQKEISGSGCIEELAGFNESEDTFAVTPAPFDSPGPADPTACRAANGNGIVIGKGACGGGN